MKKLSILILGLIYSTQLFAFCESERRYYDRSKKEFERWCTYSGIAVIGGQIVYPSFGGLIGIIPGIIASQMHILMVANEVELEKCFARNARENEASATLALNDELFNKQAEVLSKIIENQLEGVINILKQQCDDEVNVYVASFLRSDKNTDDPAVMKEMEEGVSAIIEKYF
ncbi:MAG: hypothetical protein HQK51_19780 [Oligoflexia bacterium]|nr:hypothetical protein [Oligoflexia bacterium]